MPVVIPVHRNPVNIYAGTAAGFLFLLLHAAVALRAEGLQLTAPEAMVIATVRHDVVSHCRCLHLT